jgi:SAM-dependent methyltransferase
MNERIEKLPLDCDGFILDEVTQLTISSTYWQDDPMKWVEISHCKEQRRSLILRAGDELIFTNELKIDKNYVLYVCYSAGLPDISVDGLICEIVVGLNGDEPSAIISVPIVGGKQNGDWRVLELDLGWLAGNAIRAGVRCLPGYQNDPSADWLAISQFCIARKDKVGLMLARSCAELRIKNEIDHFSNVYKHEMYASEQTKQAENASGDEGVFVRTVRKLALSNKLGLKGIMPIDATTASDPLSGESPYNYASRLLSWHIKSSPPNFVDRLKSMAESRPIRILSLCSGAARIEAGFSAQVGDLAEWTLLDINSDLLRTAAQQFPRSVKVDLIDANANQLFDFGEKWDIILCVSALHHIVELEKLFAFCHASLTDSGEFWSIGENIGRNGNRLWPDALKVANSYFGLLPERYRLNSHTGIIDTEIPDRDYSVGCFEGIRSEEIEPKLDIWFQQEHIYRRNCFLWRLMNLAYSDNYDLTKKEDRMWISKAVQAECAYFKDGGRGTELHGVYRKRVI